MLYKRILCSGIGGIFGHYLATPFHLVKTHIMSEAAKCIAVGHQHHHTGTLEALSKIYKKEGVSKNSIWIDLIFFLFYFLFSYFKD